MVTKRQDAQSIVGDKWAEKLAAYERELNRKAKLKSETESETLIIKAHVAQNLMLQRVAEANARQTLMSAIRRTNERAEDVARGYGNWTQKQEELKFIIRSLLDDVDSLHLLGDPDVKRALHRGVQRIRNGAAKIHTECLIEEAEMAEAEIAHVARAVKMRQVLR